MLVIKKYFMILPKRKTVKGCEKLKKSRTETHALTIELPNSCILLVLIYLFALIKVIFIK